MSKVREILTINVGECGINMGHTVMEQICLQHRIGKDGQRQYRKIGPGKVLYSESMGEGIPSISFSTCFQEISKDKFVTRSINIDTEPNVIDNIKCSDYAALYDSNSFISGNEDAGHNFARGHFKLGPKMIDKINDKLRKLAEDCNKLQGFIINHSVAGGTGSGLGSLILERISSDYRKKTKVCRNFLKQ